MATYAATVSLHRIFRIILENWDVLLPPPSLKMLKFAEKELKSFQKFVERLDSRSRKRMSVSLGRIVEPILKYREDILAGKVNFMGDAGYEAISREIPSLVEKMKRVEEEYYTLSKEEEEVVASSSSSRVVSKSKMVGLYDLRRQLKEDVVDPLLKNTIYSVFGMAGIGKTNLVWELFEDIDISEWFDLRVWVNVGNKWRSGETTEMKEVILAQVDPKAHKMVMGGDEEEIGERLKECLKGKRYLIVLDDVWDYYCQEYLQSLFPDNENGSLVLITTRIKVVGWHPSKPCYHIHMRCLDKEESWDLLREKVFVGVSCPPHLQDSGKKIAEKCDGLPLTIVIIASLLSKVPKSLWIDIATKRKHKIFIDAYDQMSQVLYPSYEMLEVHIKICLIYMGAFPLKYEIPKSRLINFWIAEKFIEPSINRTLESLAVEQLEILAYSSVVMVYQKDITSFVSLFRPCVKTCGLHSSWWYFCQTRARDTNMFCVLDCYDKDGIEEAIKGHSRLSIHNNVLFAIKHVYNSIEDICSFTVRSLLCFGPYCQYMVPVCFGLKFLRRLDALNIRFYDFPLEVLKLVKLSYLALTCNEILPPSISYLQKLQYLIVHPHLSIKSCGSLSNLPVEIWDMKNLKHLQIMGYDLPNLGDTSLQKLITLSNVTAGSCTILDRVPNLTKLGIEIELAPGMEEPLCSFAHISHLTKLESLKCVIVNPEQKLEVVSPISSFPCLSFSMNKLSLSGMGYPWKEMSKITSLPNLKVLKLRYNAFRGPKWEVEENGFPNLKSLLIEDLDLVKLKWDGSFKSLKVLRIKHCYKLEELNLGNLPDISEIEVVDCGPLVEWHVKRNAYTNFYLEGLFVRSSWKS